MRVTSNMYYKNVFGDSNSRLSQSLFDVNKQIASGLKIQYAQEDIRAFTETMRLDNEIATLDQSKKSIVSAVKFSDQSDAILNEFSLSMDRARTLLVKASNSGVNSEASLDAIAYELRGLEEYFKSLANTSVNGQYLFSGSAIDVKPISEDGLYKGNDATLEAFTGSGTSQQYNISGQELFLGENQSIRKEVTTNVIQINQSKKYLDFTSTETTGATTPINGSDTIRDLMGDTDNVSDGVAKHFFYITGTKSDGTSFKEKVTMADTDKIDDLLKKIGDIYGNTPGVNVVNVSMNPNGQIVVEDKIKGSSKIEFYMVGATDFSGGAAADVTNIDDLGVGETSFDRIMQGTSSATNPSLFVKEFIKSSLTAATSVAATNVIEGTLYDKVEFSKDGSKLSSSSPQIIKEDNAFATLSTKLSEVADLSQGTAGTLDGTSFVLEGKDVNGNPYSAQIDLATAGSTFSLDGGITNYEIFDVGTPRAAIAADKMTYKQLSDVIDMVVTGNLPASTGSATDYDNAIKDAELRGRAFLTYDGKIGFEEINASTTKATIALYDSSSGDFSVGADASVMTFNSNNALTIHDSKTDFFKSLNDVISAVENYKIYPDSSSGDVRNMGIENAIAMMDDLQERVNRSHSQIGAQTNTLNKSLERVEMLKMSSIQLRSAVIDTDMAEASLTLAQLSTNYQAMLSTVSKISKLSLVNYL